MDKQNNHRLYYIDLAKGICILLVLMYHVDASSYLYSNEKVSSFFFMFRMPLYYFLSGLFVSQKEGCKVFLVKKINRLIIPFLFFFFLTNLYNLLLFLVHYKQTFHYCSLIKFLFTENLNFDFSNNPIWFLISLFITYSLWSITYKLFHKNNICLAGITLIIGCLGFLCSYMEINIPFYIDSSMTCFPFLFLGYCIRQYTNLLTMELNRIYLALYSLICFFICYILADGENLFYLNSIRCNFFSTYIGGFLGALGVLLLAKAIKYIPFVNYIGRYSIIMLGLHSIVLCDIKYLPSVNSIPDMRNFLVFTIIVILTLIAIPILKKYFPWFVAQKDLFKIRKIQTL